MSGAQINFLEEIIVDNFAGGGGASTGIELATGRPVTIAINHDPDAILMHKTNHPFTEHYQASVWDVDPREVSKGRPVGLAWFSPDCKHFSKAKGGKPGMFDAIQAQIFHLYKEKRQPLLLAVDEAQYLSTAILNDIKMLMNYRYDSVNCFTLILCGEPYLNNTLRKPVHEALRQRITVHYTFSGLSDAEVAEYVRHKLVCAGGAETIIEPSALSALHSHSQGNPRIVDNLMSDALLLGAQMDKKAIDPDTILAAVSGRNLV